MEYSETETTKNTHTEKETRSSTTEAGRKHACKMNTSIVWKFHVYIYLHAHYAAHWFCQGEEVALSSSGWYAPKVAVADEAPELHPPQTPEEGDLRLYLYGCNMVVLVELL